MPLAIRAEEIGARLRDYPYSTYIYMGSVMKGVTLSVATIALLQILTNWGKEWERFLPWVASLFAILVTYMTWGRGILVTNSRANAFDGLLPLLMGVAEFLLFAVLITDPTHPDVESTLWLNWCLILAMHAGLAVPLTLNRLHNSRVKEDFESSWKVQAIGKFMESGILSDLIGASFLSISAFGAWLSVRYVLTHFMHGAKVAGGLQACLAVLFATVLGGVVQKANGERVRIDKIISRIVRQREKIKKIKPQ